jgi:hypothetical protein
VLSLRVSDNDGFGFSDDVIGEFEMACTELYKWRAHELHRKVRAWSRRVPFFFFLFHVHLGWTTSR